MKLNEVDLYYCYFHDSCECECPRRQLMGFMTFVEGDHDDL